MEQRVISFSGHAWWVKSNAGGRVGPGPNFFSESTSNVWVDELGRLHLKMTRVRGLHYCAEVVSTESFGHGTFRWYLDTRVDQLHPGAVLGLFTWSDTAMPYNGELDIEFSRWGGVSGPNAQFVVQPFDQPGHMFEFFLPVNLVQTTHSLTWQPDAVYFESLAGHDPDAAVPGTVLQQWLFAEPGPLPTNENARMNLWLYQGATLSKKVVLPEIIINRFEHVPLAAP